EVWLSHGCDDPDIVIVWHERTQHDQDRGVTTADVVARYPAAEFVIADLTWFHAESEPYRFYVTGHGAPEPIAFPEDTIAIGRWAHGFLTAANALGGWGAFAWEVECRQDHEAADWADEATRNPYL
ncbi:hypothetical protein ACH4UR_37620, partial [Streptomyces lydicus]|uniref:hypothetical protein n=1 Tax=Streptomyces lydicus TaxID=47763 RepID=UPI0033C33E44